MIEKADFKITQIDGLTHAYCKALDVKTTSKNGIECALSQVPFNVQLWCKANEDRAVDVTQDGEPVNGRVSFNVETREE